MRIQTNHSCRQAFATNLLLLVLSLLPLTSLATPYASCITNNGGTISFYLNESGGSVTVTYEDGTVNPSFNATNLPAGQRSFSLAGHATYTISVTKFGTGTPTLIKQIAYSTSRGVAVNQNPSSSHFGQVYLAFGGTGLYLHNSDLTQISPSVKTGGVAWGQTGTSTGQSPNHISIASDDFVMVTDSSTNGTAIWRLNSSLTTNQLFLGPVGETAGLARGSHGVILSPPLLTGTTAASNALLYTVDGDLVPYNSLQIYQIGAGPLPWTNPPTITGPTIGLSSANAETLGGNEYPALSKGPNGYLYASTYRLDLSRPNMQIYDATGTNLVWSSFYNSGHSDYFVNSSSGGAAGSNGIVSSAVSPDGSMLIGLHVDNHITLVNLTNGIPDVSTLKVFAGTTNLVNGRDICWDAANNFYVSSSGSGLLQSWTLGNTNTATTKNDATGTNGSFTLIPHRPVIVAWGDNTLGQCSPPAGLSNVVALAANGYSPGYDFCLALQANGKVVAWGDDGFGTTDVPLNLSNVTAIAAGEMHCLALKSDKTVVAWGYNGLGQTNVPPGLTNVISISAGNGHSLALKSDGTVVAWGSDSFGERDVPPGLTGVMAISAGNALSLALKTNGTVVAWGFNGSGQTNVPAGLSNVKAISAGGAFCLAFKNDGTVVPWGATVYGEANIPLNLSNAAGIAASVGEFSLARKSDGTVVAWGGVGYNEFGYSDVFGQTDVPLGLSNVVAIATGLGISLALGDLPPPPVNDQCSGAVLISEGVTYTTNTVYATSIGDPVPGCEHNFANGVWFKYIPPITGYATVTTCGSDFDAALAVYSGDCGSLTPTACDHGLSCNGIGATASFNGTAGMTYYIMAGGYSGAKGDLNITATTSPLINDQCSGAIDIADSGTYNVDTTLATSLNDPLNCNSDQRPGVWYKFFASASGTATITVSGNNTPAVDVFTGSCGTLYPRTCSGGFQQFSIAGGQTYWIMVTTTTGNFVGTIRATFCLPPANNFPVTTSSITDTGGVRIYYTAQAGGTEPLFYNWTFYDANNNQLSSLSASGTDLNPISYVFGPFDALPATVNVQVSNGCGGSGSGGNPEPPCGAICLTSGAPTTLNNGYGGGNGPGNTLVSPCANFGSSAKWYQITPNSSTPQTAVITAQSSDSNMAIGVFHGFLQNLSSFAPMVCNTATNIGGSNYQCRVQFSTHPAQSGESYVLAINTTNINNVLLNCYHYQSNQVIAQWNFNNTNSPATNPTPSIGSGTFALLNGTKAAYGSGAGSSDTALTNKSLSISNFTAQAVSNKTAGTQFKVSTKGYQNIALSWDQMVASAASKYYRLQWSTNGSTFNNFAYPIVLTNSGDFESQYVDLSAITTANNQSNFTVRLVSEFQNTASGAGTANYVTTVGSGYTTNGVTQLDMFTFMGAPIPRLTNAVLQNHQLSFGVNGPNGYEYVVQSSSNLSTWQSVMTNFAPFTYTDINAMGTNGKRFYRTLSQP